MRLLLSSVAILISTWSLANDLEDRVDELEMKSLLQSVQLGGELIVRHDSVTKNIQRNNEYKEYTYSLDRLRFRLNLSADLSDRVTFYGRFVASKAQNEIFPVDDQNDDPINRDQNGRAFRGADLYLERAYLNYKIMDGLVFSAGRLPIIEGGPYHLGYGEAPMGSLGEDLRPSKTHESWSTQLPSVHRALIAALRSLWNLSTMPLDAGW